MIYKYAFGLLNFWKYWNFSIINELINPYISVSFDMLDLVKEMNCYLLSMWHTLSIYLFIYFRWFGRDLECQVVALEASWF